MKTNGQLNRRVVDSIERHYKHAKDKHTYFCDKITCLSEAGVETYLDIFRSCFEVEKKTGEVEAHTLLYCEFYEAVKEYTHGDTDAAVEECYDAIAVLLRMIDVLEGRQSLGKER